MQLKTYLIYCLILYLVLVIRTLLYIEKEKTRRAEKGDRRNRKREPGRRMPPTYRQFIASPSAPSDVFTIHTIDSRSPPRQLVPAIREREGREPCPPLGDTIETTSPQPLHRSTSNQKVSASGCLSSCQPRPLPRPLPLHQVVRVGQRASRGGRSPPAHPADPLHPAGVCLGIWLLSSAYHLIIRAIAVWRPVVFERRVSHQKIFSTNQIVN